MSHDGWVNDRAPQQVDPGIDVGVDDDEFEQPYEAAQSRDPHLGDAETLLKRAVDIVVTAPTMPLSSSPRIDRDEMVELLSEALARLPEELRQARHLLRERDEFIARTRREAAEVVEAARVQSERMVQRTEVVRAAEARARHIMETAASESRRLKNETEDFLDQRLASFEILLERLTRAVATGRQKLSITGVDTGVPEASASDLDESGFFDQDR
jgi:F0F1-type ATP synthase membrane subunit b/b'